MAITGIDAVTFGVTDMKTALRFCSDWGLVRQNAQTLAAASLPRGSALFHCADGSAVQLVPAQSSTLPAAIESGNTVRQVIWGVQSRRDLQALASNLGRDRDVAFDSDGTLHSVDDIGVGIGFRISQRKKLKAAPSQFNTPGCAVRIDARAPRYLRAVPQEISHIVFGVKDIRPIERFYRQRLGFLLSDRYIGRSVFLRATPAGNHHHLFIMNTADQRNQFNHLSFKVRDIHEVIGGGQFISQRGWTTQAGPGRHLPSSACFWYFKSPLGGAFEYAADEDMVTAKWKPASMRMDPTLFSEWRFNAGNGMQGAPMADSRIARSKQ